MFAAAILFEIAWSWTGRYQPNIPLPKPPPVPNGLDDYRKAAAMLAATGGTGAAYSGPGGAISLAGQQQVASANAAALARLRAGFAHECRVPSERAMAAPHRLDFLAELRDLARLLTADAAARAAHGDFAGAVDDDIDCLHLGQDAMRGGAIINVLVGVAIEAIGARSLNLHLESLSAAECERAASRLSAVLLTQPPLVDALEEDRAVELTSLMNNSISPGVLRGADKPGLHERVLGPLYWHFTRDQTLHEIDEAYRKQIAELAKPFSWRAPPPQGRTVIAQIILPLLAGPPINYEIMSARDRMLLAAILIRGYRLRHGALAANLAAAGMDARLRRDPFSTGELVYRPAGPDYLLYSVGPDGVDDGGVPADESLAGRMKGDVGVQWVRQARQPGYGPPPQPVPHMRGSQ